LVIWFVKIIPEMTLMHYYYIRQGG